MNYAQHYPKLTIFKIQFDIYVPFIFLITLEFLIIVGLCLLIFGYFSSPYALIRDPTLIFICKYESDPTLICTSTLCHTLLKKVILHQNWSSVQVLYRYQYLLPQIHPPYDHQNLQEISPPTLISDPTIINFHGKFAPLRLFHTLRLLETLE